MEVDKCVLDAWENGDEMDCESCKKPIVEYDDIAVHVFLQADDGAIGIDTRHRSCLDGIIKEYDFKGSWHKQYYVDLD